MESPAEAPRNSGESVSENQKKDGRRKRVAFALVFVAAFGVRLLCWQDARFEAAQVQTAVTNNYKHLAALLHQNGAASFFDPSSPTSDPDLLGHPPGYPFLLAFIYSAFGESDAAAQIFQIVCDSLAASLVLLIAAELLPFGVGATAGALVALAPQFCWNSVLLLPDTLAALPVLLAVYLIIRARGRRALVKVLFAGALVGLSCWLRANALLLAPFLLLLIPFCFERGRRLRAALALVGGAVLAVAPLSVRNAVVFGHFIPVSLGAGQTLVEGIGDYDPERKFGLPDTDVELTRQEAEASGRPEYASSLFSPDGIERDRARTSRGLAVIAAHPLWFASVAARRAASMLRLERTPLTSTLPVSEGLTHAPRLAVRALQKLFITALDLPLVLAGFFVLARARKFRALVALLAVPAYYLCVQSALHTEYRYVLPVNYFLFVLAAAALYHAGLFARRMVSRAVARP
ncbi:MAG TPA: glycosyltransferase family 39 protein [Pyrinomonadaceae bacterium]|jgi:4-amino-4-deoxy-L-arabinose transferase-like glycosyltransferase|nr:glycosyltransferase family 39 protein [Pyrinomonadaceae bacterium]